MKTSTPKQRSEVDIRVAQEIKNHRDLVYDQGQRINSLKEGLGALAILHERAMAKTESDRKDLLIEFENFREEILSSFKVMNQRLGDLETKLFKILDAFSDLKERVELKYLSREDFINIIDPIENRIDVLQHDNKAKFDYFNLAVEMMKNQFTDQIAVVKKDLTPQVPEVDPLKQQLDERMKSWKVDFDGLVTEIALLKKAVAYDQKKFENIYTLIERLKEGKQ